jgi:outer membrane protein assembly factor BamB
VSRFRRQAVSISFLAAVMGFHTQSAVLGQWSQYQGNAAHSGYVAENVTQRRLVKGWEKTFLSPPNTFPYRTELAIGDEGVFATTIQGREGDYIRYALISLDRATGREEWSTAIRSYAGLVSAPSLGNNMVYVHNYGHSDILGGNSQQYPRMMAMDTATGQLRFATPHQGQWNSGSRPTVLGNQVVAQGGYYGGMDSYSATTGAYQWFSQMPQQYGYVPAMDEERVYIYFGSASDIPGPRVSTFYALDRATGMIEYTITNPDDAFTTFSSISSVVLGEQNDALVINNSRGPRQVTSFDLEQRNVRWNRALHAVNALAVSNGGIVVPLTNSLVMLDEATGADLWTWQAPSNVALTSNVVLTDNLAFVASQDTLFGIDRFSGHLVWSEFAGRDYFGSSGYNLAYFDGTLYASGVRRLITFNAVPEPGGVVLYGVGVMVLTGRMAWRRRRAKSNR